MNKASPFVDLDPCEIEGADSASSLVSALKDNVRDVMMRKYLGGPETRDSCSDDDNVVNGVQRSSS